MMANEKLLIDAERFNRILQNFEGKLFECGKTEAAEAVKTIIKGLKTEPTVDSVEVVHGRWLFVTKGQQTSAYVCSVCNRAVTVVCDEDKVKEQLAKKYPYCHCGAKMDGGGDNG